MLKCWFVLILFLLGRTAVVYGQELEINWERIYSDFGEPPDSAYFILWPFSLLEHDDFGFVVGNWSQHWYPLEADTTAIWIFKTDWNGEIEWDYWLEDLWIDNFNHLEKTPNGEFILLASVFNEDGLYYPMLIRLDCDGRELWRRSYEWLTSSEGYNNDMQITNEGRIILLGIHRNHYLFFLDTEGDSIIYREYRYPLEDGIYSFYNITQMSNTRFLVNGNFHDIPRRRYLPLFIEVNEQGDSLRGKIFDWDEIYSINKVWLSPRRTILASGSEAYFNGHNYDSTNAMLMEFNWDWELLWRQTYNNNRFDRISDLQCLPDRRIVLIGSTGYNMGDYGFLQLVNIIGEPLNNLFHQERNRLSFYFCHYWEENCNLIILGLIIEGGEFWHSKSLLMNISIPPASVMDSYSPIPQHILIMPGFPNPFNFSCSFQFLLNHPQPLEISVFDMRGCIVYNQPETYFVPGSYSFIWFTNGAGGSYFIRFKNNQQILTLPVQLIK